MRKLVGSMSLLLIVSFLVIGTIVVMMVQSQSLSLPTDTTYSCPKANHILFDTDKTTVDQVEDFLGFSHPKLAIAFDNENPIYSLSIQCNFVNDKFYVALSIGYYESYLQIYEIAGATVNLTYSILLHPRGVPISGQLFRFADRNYNGYVDFAYTMNNRYSSACPQFKDFLYYIEFKNQKWVSLLNRDYSVNYDFYDLGGDGIADISEKSYHRIPLISANSTSSVENCGRRILYTYHSWNGDEYVLAGVRVSKDENTTLIELPEYYNHDLGLFPSLTDIALRENCTEILSLDTQIQIFDTLLYHYGWKRLDDGWAEVQPIIDRASICENTVVEGVDFFETIGAYKEYFDKISD